MFRRRSSKELTVQIGYGDLHTKSSKKVTPPSAPIANAVLDLKHHTSSSATSSRQTSSSQSPNLATTPPLASTPPSDGGKEPLPVPAAEGQLPVPIKIPKTTSSSSSTDKPHKSSRDKNAAPTPTEPPSKSLIIGEGVFFEGNTEGCAAAIVGGKVRGVVKTQSLQITKMGKMEGTSIADAAEIAGVFEGTLTVANELKICATGRLRGDVTFGTIVVENGGKIEGKVNFASCPSPLKLRERSPKTSSKSMHAKEDTSGSEPMDGVETVADSPSSPVPDVIPGTPPAETHPVTTSPADGERSRAPEFAPPDVPAEVDALVTLESHSPE